MSEPPPTALYDGATYDPDISVGRMIVQLASLVRREVDGRMAAHGLTDAQWKPLWLLNIGRADTPNELARHLDCDAGAVTRLLDRLESKGLLERLRSETDRRVVHLRLTDAGREACACVPHVLASVHNEVLAGFSRDEWLQLRTLLARLLDNATAVHAAKGGA